MSLSVDDFQDIGGLLHGGSFGVVPDDFAVFDEEGLAGGEADEGNGFNAEGFDELLVGVGEKGEGEVVFLLELLLGGDVVSADADDVDAGFGKIGVGIAEATGLGGAAGGVGLGVEIDEGEAFFVDVLKLHNIAVLILGFGLGGVVGHDFFAFAGLGEQGGEKAHGDDKGEAGKDEEGGFRSHGGYVDGTLSGWYGQR